VNSRTDNTPLITIITSVYNGAAFLESCIESIAKQTYPNIQYIIIDGGSTDGTVDIITKHKSSVDYWISEKDNGIYDAWNKALRQAKGDWLTFIGADDFFLHDNTISSIVSHLNTAVKGGHTYVYGKVQQLASDMSVIEILGKRWSECREGFSKEMTLAHSCSFHHKSMFQRNGNFDDTFRIAGDYDFLLREYKTNKDFPFFIDMEISSMRSGGISGSLKNRLRMAKETQGARKKNGFNSISIPIVLWLIRIRAFIIMEAIFGPKLSTKLADIYRGLRGQKKRWSN
jgi:glycosyltransferase involved in cell wall biosynthesis